MIISKGVDIMANTAENYLDEKTTGKVNEVINLTTKILVNGEEIVINAGADMITKTTKKILDEETANKVNKATNFTASILKQL